MILLHDFFKVIASAATEAGFVATIELNPDHIVFTGHFPGHPVTPGVVQMQMVQELLEAHFGRKLKLVEMPQCKFLKIINPLETTQLDIHVDCSWEDGALKVKANEGHGRFKLSAVYQEWLTMA